MKWVLWGFGAWLVILAVGVWCAHNWTHNRKDPRNEASDSSDSSPPDPNEAIVESPTLKQQPSAGSDVPPDTNVTIHQRVVDIKRKNTKPKSAE